MESPTSFHRCAEIGEGNLSRALVSRPAFRSFLERAAIVSKPNDGGAKVLAALTRLATPACPWIEGDLRIEITGDDQTSTLRVINEMAYGYREDVFPAITLKIPLSELQRAAKTITNLTTPLTVEKDENLVFTAPVAVRTQTHATIDLDDDKAFVETVYTKPTVVRMTAVRPEDWKK